MYKSILTIFTICLFFTKGFAQEDIPTFHIPQKKSSTSNNGNYYKYAIYFNTSYIRRLGVVIGTQASIYKGFVINAEYGKPLIENLISNYSSSRYSTNIIEIGLKLYPKKEMNGIYFAVAYSALISNAKNIGSSIQLKYNREKEQRFKPFIGITPLVHNHLFFDVSLGLELSNTVSSWVDRDEFTVINRVVSSDASEFDLRLHYGLRLGYIF